MIYSQPSVYNHTGATSHKMQNKLQGCRDYLEIPPYQTLVVACRQHKHNDCIGKNLLLDSGGRSGSACNKLNINTVNTSQTHQFTLAIGLLEDLEPRAAEPSLRVVPIPTLREFAGAFEDVEELAEEGLFPSTESSSSKILSAKKPHSAVSPMKQMNVPRNKPVLQQTRYIFQPALPALISAVSSCWKSSQSWNTTSSLNPSLRYCSHCVTNSFNECIQMKRTNFKSTAERCKPQITLGLLTVCISHVYVSKSSFDMDCSESKTTSKSKTQVWRGPDSRGCPVTHLPTACTRPRINRVTQESLHGNTHDVDKPQTINHRPICSYKSP